MEKKETDTLEETVHGFRDKFNIDKYLKSFSFITFGITLTVAGITRLFRDIKEARNGEEEEEQEEDSQEEQNYYEPELTKLGGF